jgi:hypothetical protein
MPTRARREPACGHGILSAATPGMTAPDPFKCQPGSGEGTVTGNSLNGIRGASGMKTALGRWAEEKLLRRRNDQAIEPYADN